MKDDILKKLFYTKFMLLVSKRFKRQKFIDKLNSFIEKCLLEFDQQSINELREQVEFLSEEECNELYSTTFEYYDFLKFGKNRLKVDEYNPEDCRTFKQYNDALKIAFMAIDFEENLYS